MGSWWRKKLNIFLKSKRKPEFEVRVDRLIFESGINRYLAVLKSLAQPSVFVSVPVNPVQMEIEDEYLFLEMSRLVSFVEKLGYNISHICLDQDLMVPDPAELFLTKGIFRKKIRISLMDAIYLSIGNGVVLRMSEENFITRQQGLTSHAEKRDTSFDVLFSAKIYDQDNINNEVIM